MTNLNPKKQYTLHLHAKNESGWSEPSETFTIHMAMPSPPKGICVAIQQKNTLTN